jgi:anti-sigma factor RsiW
MSDPNNILSHSNGGKKTIPEDKLMAYLEGKLSAAEQHEMELWMADEGMESDALEGLRNIKPEEARHAVNKLNHDLRKSLLNKKRRRRHPQNNQFTYIAIIIILLLIVVAYIVMRNAM